MKLWLFVLFVWIRFRLDVVQNVARIDIRHLAVVILNLDAILAYSDHRAYGAPAAQQKPIADFPFVRYALPPI